MRFTTRRWLLIAIGLGSFLVYASIAALGSLRGATTHDFLRSYFLAFTLYIGAVALTQRAIENAGRMLFSIALFAMAFRSALLFAPPTLSDDVYRYIWDGHVQDNGISPYAYRVDAPELDAYSTPNHTRVNNAWMASPYLPVAQVYFAAAYRVAPESVSVFQIGALIFDLASGFFLMLALKHAGLSATYALIYLWNPLVIVEAAHGAHVDALMVMLIAATLWSFAARRSTASAGLLALATLVKPIAALLVPVLIWRWGWKRTMIYVAVTVFGIAAYAGAGLGLGAEPEGTGVFGATRIYLSQWNFNSGLFHWLEVALTGVQTPGAVPLDLARGGGVLARAIVFGVLIVVLTAIGLTARRVTDTRKLLHLALLPLAAYILLATTIHPWYLLPLTAMLPFQVQVDFARDRLSRTLYIAAWLYFSAAVALSYLTYVDANPLHWGETYEVRLIEYLPLYVLLLAALLVARRAARSVAQESTEQSTRIKIG